MRALIFQGGWSGHSPAASAELLASGLTDRGFAVEVSDSLACLDSMHQLREFSLIVPMWTMGSITREREENLVGAVLAGTGIGGFHGGMGDAFRGALEYQWMVGGQFVAHPDGVESYRVNLTRKRDPIIAGLEDFNVHTEQYYLLVDPQNSVLATSTFRSIEAPWTNGAVIPCVWKKMHGAGRVFYSALGHEPREFVDVPSQFEITLRGLCWAAGASLSERHPL